MNWGWARQSTAQVTTTRTSVSSQSFLLYSITRRWYYGWNVAAVAVLFQIVISGAAITSFSLWIPSWMQAFHTTRAPIVSAMTLTLLTSGAFSPLVGRLLDRGSIRTWVCLGIVCFAVGFALIAVSSTLWHIIAAYGVLLGFATTLCGSLSAQTLVTKWFSRRSGLALGITLTGLSLGGVVMPPVVAWLLNSVGWRAAASTLAGLSLVLLPIIFIVVRNSPQELGVCTQSEFGTLESSAEAITVEPDRRLADILCDRNFWPLPLTFVPLFTVLKAIGANFGPLTSDHGIATTLAADLLLANNLCCVIGKVILGRLADRTDARLVLTSFILITSLGFMALLGSPSAARVLLATGLLGFGAASLYPMQGILIKRYFGARGFGQVLGILNAFFLLSALGGQLAAWARDRLGSYDLFLLIAAICPPLFSLTLLWLRRPDIPRLD